MISLTSNPIVTQSSTVPSSRLTNRSSTGKWMTSPTSSLINPLPNLPGAKLPPSTVPPSFSTSAWLSSAEKKVSSAAAIETQSSAIAKTHNVFTRYLQILARDKSLKISITLLILSILIQTNCINVRRSQLLIRNAHSRQQISDDNICQIDAFAQHLMSPFTDDSAPR